jgi:hypothetical protein
MDTQPSKYFTVLRYEKTSADFNYSIGTYKSNTVTITQSLTSAAAGTLDASSTINVVNDNTNFYNINVFNSYGAGAQVFSQQ